jgi:hypothetical protein
MCIQSLTETNQGYGVVFCALHLKLNKDLILAFQKIKYKTTPPPPSSKYQVVLER